MAIQFHELPAEVFSEAAQPYIKRLNRELRELFALEGVLRQPLRAKRSDNTISRRSEVQVEVSRITPDIMESISGASSIIGVPSLTLSTTNAVGTTNTVVAIDSTIALFGTATPSGISTAGAVGTSAFAARADHVHSYSAVFGTNSPTGVTLTTAVGTSDYMSRSDHSHAHGVIASGDLHTEYLPLVGSGSTRPMTGGVSFTQTPAQGTTTCAITVDPTGGRLASLCAFRPAKGTNTLEGIMQVTHQPGGKNLSSILEGNGLVLGQSGNASIVMLNVVADSANAYTSFTADPTKALRFYAGQNGGDYGTGAPGIGFFCDGSNSGATAGNSATINFEKLVGDSVDSLDFVYFTHKQTWGSSSHWASLYDTDFAGTTGGFTQCGRLDRHTEKFAQYKATNSRWIKMDGLPGGRFTMTDAGLVEPIT